MFRHAIRTSINKRMVGFLPALSLAHRASSHGVTHHDWSQIFSHPLTDAEKELVQQQMKRTVSAVVPGKMFMRHWINTEQSTESVVDRVVGGMIIVFTIIWASGYSMLGYNSHTSAHMAGWLFIAYYIVFFTHVMWLAPVFLAGLTAQLMLN
ncbi:unnamed protein product [Phytomonas sp. EM1]|nr:unnamed protein product [Phytomonas sp. EM1]|eukprot:CCW64286.1 unnamed protein product [Phytomonas sp. isolate EM1]